MIIGTALNAGDVRIDETRLSPHKQLGDKAVDNC
jgi:hypothetical protein